MTSRRFNKGNRDRNEKAITEVLRRMKIRYSYLREGEGADLVVWLNPVELWEVKDGSKPPSARQLTEVEKEAQMYAQAWRIPYVVIETAEQAAERLAGRVTRTAGKW